MTRASTRYFVAILASVVWTCAVTHALAQPTTKPAAAAGDEPERNGPPRHGRPFRPASAQEQREALAFVQEHMPMLAKMIADAPEDSPRRTRLMGFAVDRHRWIQRIRRDEQQDFYNEMLKRLRAQDELFELARRYEESSEEARSEIREDLRLKIRELVRHWLDERERRIEELRVLLDREAADLEHDQQRFEELAEKRLSRYLADLDDPTRDLPIDPMRGGGEGGGRRDDGRRSQREKADPTSRPADR